VFTQTLSKVRDDMQKHRCHNIVVKKNFMQDIICQNICLLSGTERLSWILQSFKFKHVGILYDTNNEEHGNEMVMANDDDDNNNEDYL